MDTDLPEIDNTVDASGLACPMPLLKTKLALSGMAAGTILKVIATDSGSEKDIPAYLKQSPHILVDQQSDDQQCQFIIRKG